ncbi:hypothetical protein Sme01_06590 [Sphaerisporangium melleum]|uniref:Uncharacterized protein n=1 Tax=Sphaerisporangium melleum TaxID=321316 RepID=A0A917RM87_9ACTN|nr:hypothetical protein [Sphaerisporangium melleum]GGL14364.1 hypothetical protein GCM10007964_65440 [Sphaerisporangium melleum]GII68183.1 hypothetical protein Sme01_06590 [Sphaerisporangium melleum]
MLEIMVGSLLVAPLVFLVLAIRLVLRGVRTLLRGRPPSAAEVLAAKPLAELAAMSALGVALCWAWGIGSGIYVLDPDQMCAAAAAPAEVYAHGEFVRVATHYGFPVAATCLWDGGTAYDLVPPWVNPMIVLFALTLVAALLALVGGVVLRRRGHMTPATE